MKRIKKVNYIVDFTKFKTTFDDQYISLFGQCIQTYFDYLKGQKLQHTIQSKVLIGFFTNYCERLEDANRLLKIKHYDSAAILLRTAFEDSIYLAYIFENPKYIEKRTKAYYFSRYQKYLNYLLYINKSTISTQSQMVNSLNNFRISNQHYKNIFQYLNQSRQKYRNCFNYLKNYKEKFKIKRLNVGDKIEKCKPLDNHRWYNGDNKTNNFIKLVLYVQKQCSDVKGFYTNPYFFLYLKQSDKVHSDGLGLKLSMHKRSFDYYEIMNPTNLTYYYSAGILMVNHMIAYTKGVYNKKLNVNNERLLKLKIKNQKPQK